MPAPKIRSMGSFCDTTSRALSYFLGAGAVILAIAVVFTARPAAEIAEWAQNVLGWSFVLLLAQSGLHRIVQLGTNAFQRRNE